MEFVVLNQQEYDMFEKSYPAGTFWQTTAMGNYKKNQGCTLHYYGMKEANKILCAAQIIGYRTVGGMIIYHALRGFLIDYQNEELLSCFLSNLKKELKKQRGIYLHFNPYVCHIERDADGSPVDNGFNNEFIVTKLKEAGCRHAGYIRGFDETTEPRWMMVLDLRDKDEKTLLKEMDQQTRWSINRSLKYPIDIVTLDQSNLHLFKDMLDQTAERRGFSSYPLSYFEEMLQTFGSDTVEIVIAQLSIDKLRDSLNTELQTYENERRQVEEQLASAPASRKYQKKLKVAQEGIELTEKKLLEADALQEEYGSLLMLAGAMFIWHRNEVIYLLSASDEKYRKFNAPYAIQWKMIQKALKMNLPRYNFYGTSGIFEKDADDYGVYEFKKGFHAHVEELIGDFDMTIDPIRFFIYRNLKKIQTALKR